MLSCDQIIAKKLKCLRVMLAALIVSLVWLPNATTASVDRQTLDPQALDPHVVTPSLQRMHDLLGGLSVDQGFMAWPVAGPYRISSRFGVRQHPIKQKRRFHYGLDIAAPMGTPIVSVASGRVTFAGWRTGYGRVVEIEHGRGWVSRYAHAKTISVHPNQQVLAGQLIGQVGRSGHATGAHLHLEIEQLGKRMDPMAFWVGVSASSPQ